MAIIDMQETDPLTETRRERRRRRKLDHSRATRRARRVGPTFLDPAPLLAVAERKLGPDAPHTDVAALLRVAPGTVAGWRRGATLVHWQKADACAVALGFHPLSLWPDYYDDLLA